MKFAVVSAGDSAEAWEAATGDTCPPELARALAEACDTAYTRGFNGLGVRDLVGTVRRLAPREPLVAVQLVRDWYESGELDASREGGLLA